VLSRQEEDIFNMKPDQLKPFYLHAKSFNTNLQKLEDRRNFSELSEAQLLIKYHFDFMFGTQYL